MADERAGIASSPSAIANKAATTPAALPLPISLAAVATSPATLLSARCLQGAGVALLATAGLLSVLRALPGGGAAMTACNVSSGLGGSGGLLTGGYLTAEFGWRAIFWLSTALSGVLLVGSALARVRAAAARQSHPGPADFAALSRPSRAAEAAAIAANLLVFVNYSIWVVSLPLLGSMEFGFDAGQVGIIRRAGAARALAIGFGLGGIGMLLVPLAPSAPWLLAPMTLYEVGQVAGNSSAGDLILRLGGGGGPAVGAVRLSCDVGLVAGPAAAGALADTAGVKAPFVVLGAMALVVMGLPAFAGWRSHRRRRQAG